MQVWPFQTLWPVTWTHHNTKLNTVHTNTPLHRLVELQVNPTLVLWRVFLQDRPQQVLVNVLKSSKLILNTELPQGCVLSPILFSVYSNNISCSSERMRLLKYGDDMAPAAHLTGTNLVLTFRESSLELNIANTKELRCGNREKPTHNNHLFSNPSVSKASR